MLILLTLISLFLIWYIGRTLQNVLIAFRIRNLLRKTPDVAKGETFYGNREKAVRLLIKDLDKNWDRIPAKQVTKLTKFLSHHSIELKIGPGGYSVADKADI